MSYSEEVLVFFYRGEMDMLEVAEAPKVERRQLGRFRSRFEPYERLALFLNGEKLKHSTTLFGGW